MQLKATWQLLSGNSNFLQKCHFTWDKNVVDVS